MVLYLEALQELSRNLLIERHSIGVDEGHRSRLEGHEELASLRRKGADRFQIDQTKKSQLGQDQLKTGGRKSPAVDIDILRILPRPIERFLGFAKLVHEHKLSSC